MSYGYPTHAELYGRRLKRPVRVAQFILKRREYLGKIRTMYGYKPHYTAWETVSAWDTLENAQAAYAAIPANARGMMVHAIWHKGVKVYSAI